jgi:hypothetical protein
MQQGDFALAETHIGRAERLDVRYDPLYERFLDSPAKARRTLRELQAAGAVHAPGAGEASLAMLDGDAKSTARSYLDKARLALQQGDLTGAVTWRQRAIATGASFAPGEYSPDTLAGDLRRAGVAEELLAMRQGPSGPAPTVRPEDFAQETRGDALLPMTGGGFGQHNSAFQSGLVTDPNTLERPRDLLPMVPGADRPAAQTPGQFGYITDDAPAAGGTPRRLPTAEIPLDTRKQEALRLLAMSRVALDRGDLQNASLLAEQARALEVPDRAFGPNEPRPDHLMMEIQSVVARRGTAPSAPGYAVTQAYDPGNDSRSPYPVTSSVYRPDDDRSRTMAAQAVMPMAPGEPGSASVSPGVGLYQQGLAALERQQQAEAMELFSRAWQHEAELDPQTRQSLRDKLTLLRVATPREVSPSENPLEQIDSQQQLLRQKLSREVFQELSATERMRTTDPRGALTRLRNLRARVEQETLDLPTRRQILALVDQGIGNPNSISSNIWPTSNCGNGTRPSSSGSTANSRTNWTARTSWPNWSKSSTTWSMSSGTPRPK